MARFMVIFGIVLILVSVAFLILFLAGSEIEYTGQILESFVCEEGETLDQKYRQTFSSDGSGRTTDYYCVSSEGDERDITGTMVLYAVGGFLGTFLPGLFMTIIGANILARRATQTWTQNFMGSQGLGNVQASSIQLSSGRSHYEAKTMQEVQEVMQQVFSQTGQAAGGGSLTNKLKQLEDARNQGLISQSEYESTRQAILDSMDD